MTVLLATATERELRAALKHAGNGWNVPRRGELGEATVFGRPLRLLVTGVGPLNAALSLGRCMCCKPSTLVVNVGVCGSFDLDQAPLGSRILAHTEIWPEYGLVGPEGVNPHGIGLCQGKVDGEAIWDRVGLSGGEALERAGLAVPKGLRAGVSLTVAGVTGTDERAELLRNKFGALAENMEGFALAYGCRLCRASCVELRTVSNRVGERSDATWDLDGALAALGSMTEELLRAA